MYNTVDGDGQEKVPKEDANEFAPIFFIIFLVISNFFVLNMFVGVIVDSFNINDDAHSQAKQRLQERRREAREEKARLRYEQ